MPALKLLGCATDNSCAGDTKAFELGGGTQSMDIRKLDITYTAAEAARILRLSSQRVRQLLASGELRGVRDEVGHWEVDSRSVHALLDERREVLFGALEDPQRLSELEAEVRELRYFLGRAEARADMSAQAESELRVALERERARTAQEQAGAEEVQRDAEQFIREREEAQEEARRLREELEAERSKGFWRRLFGG